MAPQASWPRDMPADSLESGNLEIQEPRNPEVSKSGKLESKTYKNAICQNGHPDAFGVISDNFSLGPKHIFLFFCRFSFVG